MTTYIWSTLAQLMACCLASPSHYLNQCWLLLSEIMWLSPKTNFTISTQATIRWQASSITLISYLGSKLWNLLASEYSEVNDVDYERLKFLIKYWAGPNHDSAQGHFLWSTLCVLHVCFRNHFFINLIAHTLRARDCQFDSFVVTGGTVSCHYDNLRCHRWWRGCRVDDLLFSEYDIALYILALFICRILAFWLMLFVVHTTLNTFYLILSYLILSYSV